VFPSKLLLDSVWSLKHVLPRTWQHMQRCTTNYQGKHMPDKSNRYMFVVSAIVCDEFFVLALECFV